MNRYRLAATLASLFGILYCASASTAPGVTAKHASRLSADGRAVAPPSNVLRLADARDPTGGAARKYLFGATDTADEVRPPDQAFTASIAAKDANTLIAVFTPANGYFLYRDKMGSAHRRQNDSCRDFCLRSQASVGTT